MRHLLLIPTAALAAITLVAACGGSDSSGPGNPPPAADVSIVSGAFNKGFQAYSPDTFTVSLAAGGTVTWRNDDNVAHTVTDTTVANAFNLAFASKNETDSVVFTLQGQYPYKCSIHTGMRGLVIVTP